MQRDGHGHGASQLMLSMAEVFGGEPRFQLAWLLPTVRVSWPDPEEVAGFCVGAAPKAQQARGGRHRLSDLASDAMEDGDDARDRMQPMDYV